MACDIRVLFSGNKDPLILTDFVDFSESPIMEFAKALAQDPEKRELIKQNIDRLYATDTDDFQYKNTVGNISIKNLISTFPVPGGWPSIDKLREIMDVDNFNIIYTEGGEAFGPVQGFYRVKIGKESVRYLRISRKDLGHFRNWLNARLLAEETKNKEREYSPEFNFLLQEYKLSAYDLLIKYLNGDLEYKPIKYNGKNIDTESIIQDEIFKIQGKVQKRIFKTEFFNALGKKLRNIGDFKYSVPLDVFYQKLDELNTDKKEEIQKVITNKKLSEIKKIQNILDLLKEFDPEFTYLTVESVDKGKNTIILSTPYQTIDSKYGLSYKQVQEQHTYIDEHKGYDIYEREGRYYIVKGPITQELNLRPYKSVDDAILAIDEKIKYEKLSDAGLVNLKNNKEGLQFVTFKARGQVTAQEKNKSMYRAGQIIKSLDLELPAETLTSEIRGVINGTYNDFVNYINSNSEYDEVREQILEKIDTAEKAVAFFYLSNKEKNYLEAIEKISNAEYKYYYITDSYGFKGRVVEISTDQIRNIKDYEDETITEKHLKSWDLPKAKVMQSLVNSIRSRLVGTGFTVELMTQKEIKDKYGDESAKSHGFVSGNTIVINSTTADLSTPLHEYAHIFLGILKATNFDKYREMVDTILTNFDRGKSPEDRKVDKKRAYYKTVYKDMSDIDIDEEVFADLFAGYILNGKTEEFFKFSKEVGEVTEESRLIWDMISSDDKRIQFADIWNYPISTLVSVNSDMIIELQDQSNFLDKFRTYRQAARWIGDKISKGEIREDCGV